MGAISTTLNLNGNMGTQLSALAQKASQLHSTLQSIGTVRTTGIETVENKLQGIASTDLTVTALDVIEMADAFTVASIGARETAKAVKDLKNSLQNPLSINIKNNTKGQIEAVSKSIEKLKGRLKSIGTVALNIKGRMASQLNELKRRADRLYGSLQRIKTMDFSNVSNLGATNLSSLQTTLSSINASLAMIARNASRAGTSLSWMGNSISNANGASSGLSRGIGKVSNSARDAARHAASLTASLMAAWAVYGTFHAMRDLFSTANEMTNIKGRMAVGMDEGSVRSARRYIEDNFKDIPVGVSLDDLAMSTAINAYEKRLMDVANNTRQSFADTASFASKLAVNVGGKAFKGMDEIVRFTEQLNKVMVASGTSGAEARSVLTQLPQSLASGLLQGDELRALRENSGLATQIIEDYLHNVKGLQGDIKDLGSSGQISARDIVEAFNWASDKIDTKFGKMPYTWEQRWTRFCNTVTEKLKQTFGKLEKLANAEGTEKMFEQLAEVVAFFGRGVANTFAILVTFAQKLAEVGLLAPVLTTALSVMAGAIVLLISKQVKSIAVGALQIAQEQAKIVWTALATAATSARNTALAIALALQITYTAGGWAAVAMEIAHTALIWGKYFAFLAFASVLSVVAVGMLAYQLAMVVVNSVMAIYQLVMTGAVTTTIAFHLATWAWIALIPVGIGLIIALARSFFGVSTAVTSVAYKVGWVIGWVASIFYNAFVVMYNQCVTFAEFFAGFLDPAANQVATLIHNLADNILDTLSAVASAIDALFGSNLASAVNSFKGTLSGWIDKYVGERSATVTFKRKELLESGAFADKIGVALDGLVADGIDMFSNLTDGWDNFGDSQYDKSADGFNSPGGKDANDKLGKIAKNTEKTAENLDWLIAANERRAINAFTYQTYEVPVNVTVNGGGRNLAGIADEIRWNLTDYLTNALKNNAEGATTNV